MPPKRRTLEVLNQRKKELETCGYCPKLCRSACPISNAEPRDTLTPWGKMSMTWTAARGQVDPTPDFAALAWACSGCFACRERCEHRNPVVPTLFDARAEYQRLGVAPVESERVLAKHSATVLEAGRRLDELAREPGVRSDAPNALLVGCAYLRQAPAEARDIVRSVVRIVGSVRLIRNCCGAPLAYAGDKTRAEQTRAALSKAWATAQRRIVADPGCAVALADDGAITLPKLAAEHKSWLKPAFGKLGPLRYHDPCQLGRGLGQYDEPRQILERILGEPAQEFVHVREHAACSGAGAIVPLTMPRVSARISEQRLEEHARLGGGTIVTACASSLVRFRKSGAQAIDLATLIRKSLLGDD